MVLVVLHTWSSTEQMLHGPIISFSMSKRKGRRMLNGFCSFSVWIGRFHNLWTFFGQVYLGRNKGWIYFPYVQSSFLSEKKNIIRKKDILTISLRVEAWLNKEETSFSCSTKPIYLSTLNNRGPSPYHLSLSFVGIFCSVLFLSSYGFVTANTLPSRFISESPSTDGWLVWR